MFRKLILKEWFRFFLASLISLLLLVTVGNLISGLLRSNVEPSEVLINYLIELPVNINRILPIACLVASLFSINKLKNRNELVAIFASGFSRRAFVATIILASSFVGFTQFYISGFIDPWVKSKRHQLISDGGSKFRNLEKKGLWASTIGSGRMWYKSNDYYLSFSRYDPGSKKIQNVAIYQFSPDYKLKGTFKIDLVSFLNGQWIGKNVEEIGDINGPSFPKVQKSRNIPVPIDVGPDDFRQLEADITTLSLLKLFSYIKNLKSSGINVNEYLMLYLNPFSSGLICIIFALVASIPIFNPNRRNSSLGKNIASVFVLTVMYWLINSYIFELGQNSKIDPYIASFLVPIMFSLFLFFIFIRNKRLA